MRLPSFRYEEIKRVVAKMYSDSGINFVPVDPFKIAQALGYILVPYSSLDQKYEAACLRISVSRFKFLLTNGDSRQHFIVYNDRKCSGHVRFTILHEIGHILLGHMQESDLAEAEANFFAKYAIAPPSLVHVVKPNDYMDVADAFGLSSECAFNSWNYYRKWLNVSGVKDYERQIDNIFVIRNGSTETPSIRMLA